MALPKPPSHNTGMPQMRRKSAIRTAAGTAQEQFLERVRQLAEDPLRILPEPVGPEPPALASLRRRVERIRDRGPGLLDRFDRGIVGAVWRSMRLAAREAAPRLLDAKVEGARRFYIQLGHVPPVCNLGVQNHDEPRALLMAYGPLAKRGGLHVFAGERLWASGDPPWPPPEWFTDLAQAADIHLAEEAAGRWGCGHGDRDRVLLRFPGGPAVAVCSACGKRAGNLHTRLRSRYRGPRERTPVDVEVLRPDGSTLAPGAEELALYRAARAEEATVIASALEQWRRGHTGRHYVLGERDFGEDLEAFLGALGARPWEREALRRAVPEGHVGREATVAAVLAAHPGRFTAALEAVLPGEPGFAARHPGVGPQELLRLAHLEAERRKAVADLPAPSGLGPVGAWADRFVRFRRTHNERETLDRLRDDRNALAIPPGHFWAFAQALGGSLVGLERHFDVQAREAGEAWREAARRVLDATGAAYVEALDRYLQETGSGERAEA